MGRAQGQKACLAGLEFGREEALGGHLLVALPDACDGKLIAGCGQLRAGVSSIMAGLRRLDTGY